MTLGIVGHEAAKFTAESQRHVRRRIREAIHAFGATRVVSGACPLGGVDIWAVEEARAVGVQTRDFPPATNDWDHGFKPRNIQIAEASDLVLCYVVDVLPKAYAGRRFDLCYHCVRNHGGGTDHVKSGGCWTVNYARGLGKPGAILVVKQTT